MKVDLRIDSMRDFHPEQVARQIPQLSRLIAARNLLQDLRNRVISTSEFRKGLEQIVRDPAGPTSATTMNWPCRRLAAMEGFVQFTLVTSMLVPKTNVAPTQTLM